MHRIALALFLVLFAATAQSRTFLAEVTYVTDGDTLWVRTARGVRKQLRLRSIDAPEICQEHGADAKAALSGRVLHRQVAVSTSGRDEYQRWLATVRIDGEDVGAWLVADGHAWAHRWHAKPTRSLAVLELTARRQQRGLWGRAQPMEPRQFRKIHGSCHA